MKPLRDYKLTTLRKMLVSKKITPEVKQRIYKYLADNKVKSEQFIKDFFNAEKNKFWKLAKYQLYREGKDVTTRTGNRIDIWTDNPRLTFDRMMDVKVRYDIHKLNIGDKKSSDIDIIKKYEEENATVA